MVTNDVEIARLYVLKAKNAKKRNLEYTLTFSQFKSLFKRTICQYTGVKFVNNPDSWQSKTFERIDNSKGYTKENTVVVTKAANQLKSLVENPDNKLTMQQAFQIFEKVLNHDTTTS